MIALLTSEALQMIDITSSAHDHLERGYDLAARRAVPRISEKPKVVPLAEDEVRLRVERGPHFAEPAVAAPALEAVLVPEEVQGLEEVALGDGLAAAGALLRTSARRRLGGLVF